MNPGKQRLWIDVGFITGLLALSAAPLVVGRQPEIQHGVDGPGQLGAVEYPGRVRDR